MRIMWPCIYNKLRCAIWDHWPAADGQQGGTSIDEQYSHLNERLIPWFEGHLQ